VEVAVRDTGSGIAPEELPRVFDRFYRADAARERSGGTGLGLAIARMIVDQHGGEIRAESTPGAGSTFVVRLPVAGALVVAG
jgi:two-component system sensor histidine kinase BaeS